MGLVKLTLNFSYQSSNNLWHAQTKQMFLEVPGHFGRNYLSMKASSSRSSKIFRGWGGGGGGGWSEEEKFSVSDLNTNNLQHDCYRP